MAIKIIETPRDAMQGLKKWIPTEQKVKYIEQLLRVGFHTLDVGSFVSEKVIPQMRDTELVVKSLENIEDSKTKLSVVVANRKGIDKALYFDSISYVGFPFSISEVFQQKNTGKSRVEAIQLVEDMVSKCVQRKKTPVVYISMCFGNPYNDPWSLEEIDSWIKKIVDVGVHYFSLSDTIGCASDGQITDVFSMLNEKYNVDFGAHFHSIPREGSSKIEAAFHAGCSRFDGALQGLGGCPMAKDDLLGNMATEMLIDFFDKNGVSLTIDRTELQKAQSLCKQILMA